jgi:hypothetical protein
MVSGESCPPTPPNMDAIHPHRKQWGILSCFRERTNSYDQEVVGNAHPLRMRGLKAFCFAGAIRTLAQLLRRALTFVLDVTYTQGKIPVAQT